MYKALALDLDGTLTNSNKEITLKTKETLFKAMDKGVKVILASGRPVIGITKIARELELYERGGYIMAFNGGEIIDCKSGETVKKLTVAAECVNDICAEAKRARCTALTYSNSEIVAQSDTDPYVLKEKKCVGADVRAVEDLAKFVNYPTPKFLIVGEHEKLVSAEKALKEKYADKLNIFYSESYFLEICPMGVSKKDGLKALCAHMGIDKEELMACGDGLNDMPMLEFAGLSVAMANSYPDVLKYADCITLSNDEDGVAAAVEKFILRQFS